MNKEKTHIGACERIILLELFEQGRTAHSLMDNLDISERSARSSLISLLIKGWAYEDKGQGVSKSGRACSLWVLTEQGESRAELEIEKIGYVQMCE